MSGDDGPDAGLGEQRRTGGVLVEQCRELTVELGDLIGEEPDTRGDRAQRDDRDTVLAGRAGGGPQLLDGVELVRQ
ncbi:MAG: hypothetical protein ACM4D3_01545 [Candidatus Sericytochromatia bacterium]